MGKLKMQTENKVDKNIEVIVKLFPNTLTETIKGYDEQGKPIVEHAIDFDLLKQELSNVVIEGNEERYQMNWPDKKKSILLANSPINKTLRPCREESVDFDNTKNLYIEGDNLDVLKLLQETYLNRVRMIYIDPPYNTGKDSFVYNDDFSMNQTDFSQASGQYDEDGNIMFDIRQNNESNGKFHTDWLNMMLPRLKLAKDLLTEDGVIFISIDDNEVENLKKICNEIFGEGNFLGHILWQKKTSPQNDAKKISPTHDHILLYCKNFSHYKLILLPRDEESLKKFKNPDSDFRGAWTAGDLSSKTKASNHSYPIKAPGGKVYLPPAGRQWAPSLETFKRLLSENRIYFGMDNNSQPKQKQFLNEIQQGIVPTTIWFSKDVGDNTLAVRELRTLGIDFDSPKPVSLIKRMISLGVLQNENSILLDFFSGSATTAHAVMQLNFEDGGNRQFIMVQLPEETEENSEAYKKGYKNICEIGKERIRRAGKKIKEENPDKAKNLDTGFRVLKLDSSNMKDIFYKPQKYDQGTLDGFEKNIKEDRTPEDLLFQVMLELGELLSSDIEEMIIGRKKVFNVDGNNIIACFDTDITNEVVIEIAKLKPFYAVFRDSSMANDSVAANFEQIFQTYSPTTVRKVL
jgi:adenine-specific DNA-methyltransferase